MLDMTNAASVEAGAPVLTRAQSEERRRMTVWLEERIAASKKKPSAEVVTLTPVLAQLLLERNPVNRPIGRYNSAVLASDVSSGRFMFNGESIVVSNTGFLLDGQHRCITVVGTGTPIETVIAFGPKEEARFTIDIGSPKSAPHFLAMKGRKDTNNLAAAVGNYLQWRKTSKLTHVERPTKTEIVEAADHFHGMDTSVGFVHAATKRRLGSRSILAFCHFVFWKKAGREAADYFILKVMDGDGLRKGDPILYCRNRLMEMERGVRPNDRAEVIFKCWNAHRRGETVTKVLVTGGSLPKVER